ncbi:conjugal transfer protein TraO [Riemerella columbina]|uniref:conjugal transfer protein TraO n=1 Tax=Riemerella columbina TaxID=103810 RepID=UPI000378AA75|nr:conjugal transfer protein TraO [Riemerella columbina]
MKRLLLVMCGLLGGISLLNAQRLFPGQQGLEASVNLLPTSLKLDTKAYDIRLGYVRYTREGDYWQFGVAYTRNVYIYREQDLPIETFTAESGYSLSLIGNSSRNVSLNVGLSGVVGYELINQGNHTLFDGAVINNKDAVVYGGLARLRLERYLVGDVLVFLQGQTQMLWGTQREQLRPHIGLGFRITL